MIRGRITNINNATKLNLVPIPTIIKKKSTL